MVWQGQEIRQCIAGYNKSRKETIVEVPAAIDIYTCPVGDTCSAVYAATLGIGDAYKIIRSIDGLKAWLEGMSQALGRDKLVMYTAHIERVAYILSVETEIGDRLIKNDGSCLYITVGKIEIRDYNAIGMTPIPGVKPVRMCYSITPMTEGEKEDIKVVNDTIIEDISHQAELAGGVSGLPLTMAGYTRRAIRKARAGVYCPPMKKTEIELAHAAQWGGACVSSMLWQSEMIAGVESYDEDSAYIAALLAYRFPTGRGYEITMENPDTLDMLWIGTVTIRGLNLKADAPAAVIPYHRAIKDGAAIIINKRVKSAEKITITMASPMWDVIRQYYNYDYAVVNGYAYHSDKISQKIRNVIIDLYNRKEALKGDRAHVYEYKQTKKILLSVYGISAQRPVGNVSRETYSGRLLPYTWGCMITAYAQRVIWDMIYHAGENFIYSDTDSVKFIDSNDRIKRYIADYNAYIHGLIKYMTGQDMGKLGQFIPDGNYKRLKVLGEKCYMYEDVEGVHAVISGMKKDYSKYMTFDRFYTGAEIPPEESGAVRVTHGLNSDIIYVKDRDGINNRISDRAIYIETPVSYTLGGDIVLKIKEALERC